MERKRLENERDESCHGDTRLNYETLPWDYTRPMWDPPLITSRSQINDITTIIPQLLRHQRFLRKLSSSTNRANTVKNSALKISAAICHGTRVSHLCTSKALPNEGAPLSLPKWYNQLDLLLTWSEEGERVTTRTCSLICNRRTWRGDEVAVVVGGLNSLFSSVAIMKLSSTGLDKCLLYQVYVSVQAQNTILKSGHLGIIQKL